MFTSEIKVKVKLLLNVQTNRKSKVCVENEMANQQ